MLIPARPAPSLSTAATASDTKQQQSPIDMFVSQLITPLPTKKPESALPVIELVLSYL